MDMKIHEDDSKWFASVAVIDPEVGCIGAKTTALDATTESEAEAEARSLGATSVETVAHVSAIDGYFRPLLTARLAGRIADGSAVYDLAPQSGELWAVVGPEGWDGKKIDPDNLPDGFRWSDWEWEAMRAGA